jgi:O-6-methylguanine DNA methyltransferase
VNHLEDKDFSLWLGDEPGEANAHLLLEALDDLYAAGPGERATQGAITRLRRTMSSHPSETVYYASGETSPLGTIYAAVNDKGLVALDFGLTEREFIANLEKGGTHLVVFDAQRVAGVFRQLAEYLDRRRTSFDLSLDLNRLADFQRQVLQATLQVPHGQVVTYNEIARRIGRPRAARAVGQALSRNPIPIIIPCHRVVATDGSLRGYKGNRGLHTKAMLLSLETSL